VQQVIYAPFGEVVKERNQNWNNNVPAYLFNAKELDEESGMYYFGGRYNMFYMWSARDPAFERFPHLSPYSSMGNNPVLYVDPNGNIIDISKLTESEKKTYTSNLKILNTNKLFYAYYSRLANSETTYQVSFGGGSGGGAGSFDPSTNEIRFQNSLTAMSQEMFHAYQSDLGVYTSADLSVRETEGDLVSDNIVTSIIASGTVNMCSSVSIWGTEDIGSKKYIGNDGNFDLSVLSASFDADFNKAVDNRISFYLNRQKNEGVSAPKTYIQPNSRAGALALKRLVREVYANDNLVGPRLPNGDFYSE
jgi:RHS repeat-associated protein